MDKWRSPVYIAREKSAISMELKFWLKITNSQLKKKIRKKERKNGWIFHNEIKMHLEKRLNLQLMPTLTYFMGFSWRNKEFLNLEQ